MNAYNKWCKATAHHLLNDAQLAPKQRERERETTLIPFKSPSAWSHMVWNIPLARLSQLPQFCPLPAPCHPSLLPPPPSPLLIGAEKLEQAWLCTNLLSNRATGFLQLFSATTRNTGVFIDLVFLLKPKHSIIPAVQEKKNSVPAETNKLLITEVRPFQKPGQVQQSDPTYGDWGLREMWLPL